jgi:putative protein-disulfide isomerase
MPEAELIVAHDPMCSWCWAFSRTLQSIEDALPDNVSSTFLLGGLAPDSDEPMPAAMQQHLAGVWKQIESHVPGTEFNHDFWTKCAPRRSTWPACRAMIAAQAQRPDGARQMSKAIQHAYYLQARNPSDDDTLIALADDLKLDTERFAADLHSAETKAAHQQQMQQCQQLGIQGYPSMVLLTDNVNGQWQSAQRVALDHNSADVTFCHLQSMLGTTATG